MSKIILLLFCLTILLSCGRNMFSKHISGYSFGSSGFFELQTLIFLSGTICLAVFHKNSLANLAVETVIYAVIYGVLLLSSQWCYTAALKYGNLSICSTVYSFGFIIPTLSGALFWNENLTVLKIAGLLLAIPAIFLSVKKNEEKSKKIDRFLAIPLLTAMLSSGGLGLLQKIQQKSIYADQKEQFVLLAFGLAACISFLMMLLKKRKSESEKVDKKGYAAAVGICFGCCNLLNTTLAGAMDSAVFFPIQNVSVIMLSMLAGCLFFKEKIGKKELIVLGLGVSAVILLSI